MDELLRANEEGVVIGLKGAAGVVPRLEIDQLLLEKPDTFNLFLLALKDLQEEPDHTTLMGYFQVAGIHGLPKSTWKNVEWPDKKEDSKAISGYCAHGILTFPTWHRPYLAMFEQTLFVKMYEIAKRFSTPQRHIDAVKEFRLPYWDYYRPRDYYTQFPGITGQFDGSQTSYPFDFGAPQIFTLEKVMLRLPNGKMKLEYNPLRTFWFPLGNPIPEKQWEVMNMSKKEFSRGHTVRHLLKAYNSPYQGTNVRLNQTLNKDREPAVSVLLSMIANDPGYGFYEVFAMNGRDQGTIEKNRFASLESLHNAYHGNIGSGGHMGRVPVAAFDPIFWMHHANIDRYLAIWQDVYPDKWFDGSQSSPMLESDLLPFFSPKGQDTNGFWTSKSARSTEAFGHKYSDVKGNPQTTKENFRRLYSWSIRPQPEPQGWKPTPPKEMEPLDLSGAQVFKDHPEYVAPTPPTRLTGQAKANLVSSMMTVPQPLEAIHLQKKSVPSAKFREWFVDDTVERLALNGAFSIDYFIGPKGGAVDVKPEEWGVAPTLAGSTYIFAAPTDICDNCGVQSEQAHLVTDTTSLTGMLMDYIKIGELTSIEPKDVKPFLVDRLRWRVVTVNGVVKDPRELAGFKVSVSSKVSSVPVDDAPPAVENYPDITQEIIRRASTQAEHLSH